MLWTHGAIDMVLFECILFSSYFLINVLRLSDKLVGLIGNYSLVQANRREYAIGNPPND